jgi:hypothetical protein
MAGPAGGNIRTLVVGLPAGLVPILKNPPYTVGSGESTELNTSPGNIIEVNVYKKDIEYEELMFKPQTFLFDTSLFLLPDAFESLGREHSKRFDDVVTFAEFTNIRPSKMSRSHKGNASGLTRGSLIGTGTSYGYSTPGRSISKLFGGIKKASSSKSYSGLGDMYDFLGTSTRTQLATNHVIDRLLQVYYNLLFGLEMDELTFIHDDKLLGLYLDADARSMIQEGESSEAVSDWIKTGNVAVSDLLQQVNLSPYDVKLNKAKTHHDAHSYLKDNSPVERLLKGSDLTMFRSLTSSRVFNMDMDYTRMISPKLFDRVFMIPIDPDEFEIDLICTREQISGKKFLQSELFSTISITDQNTGVTKLIPRKRSENYSSFNSFYVDITLPEAGTTSASGKGKGV